MDILKPMLKRRCSEPDTVFETFKIENKKASYYSRIKEIKVNGTINIVYIDEGDEPAEALLFIHGMGTGIPAWEQNINELKRTYRCIALDLPGHGFSDTGDYSYSINFYSDVILSFLNQLALTNLTLIGHSLGAQVGVMAALKETTLIKRLVLASPAGLEPYTYFEKQLLITSLNLMVSTGNAFLHNYLTQLIGFCNNYKNTNEFASKLTFNNCNVLTFGRVLKRTVEAILNEEVGGMMNEISQPVLIVVGEKDRVSPYQYMHGQCYEDLIAREAKKNNKVKFVSFSSCGHFVQVQKSDQFNKEVHAFMLQNMN